MHLVSLMTRQAAIPAVARTAEVRAHSWAVVCDVYYLDPMVSPGGAVRAMTALAPQEAKPDESAIEVARTGTQRATVTQRPRA
jgi:hypothetical protein